MNLEEKFCLPARHVHRACDLLGAFTPAIEPNRLGTPVEVDGCDLRISVSLRSGKPFRILQPGFELLNDTPQPSELGLHRLLAFVPSGL